MTHTSLRFAAVLLLAVALEPLAAVLRAVVPGVPAEMAHAQLADPGFGDPTTLTPPASTGVPQTGYGSNAFNPYLTGNYISVAPAQPSSPVRPSTWPGGAPSPVPGYERPADGVYRTASLAPPVAPPPTAAKTSPSDPPYDPAEILARVGSERVQACEILPMINKQINKAVEGSEEFAALPPERRQQELYRVQRSYMQAALQEIIKTKLLVSELRSHADAKMLKENEKRIRDNFNTEYIKHLQEEYGASSTIDLENKLRALGGSLESQRALYVDQNLAAGWLHQAVKKEEKHLTHDQLLTYYRAHISDWQSPARARWEQLTAKWDNFPSRQAAVWALAQWGDDVWYRRRPFTEVAKEHSQEHAADDGGVHDWASKGSLRSAELDTALFSLPVGQMSRIIQDEEGCHIIRVIEREDAKTTPFTEVQPEIKKSLHDGGENKQRAEYIEKLRETTPVWTVFDDE